MAIKCPYCSSIVTVKNAKPGRYAPKCPKCTTVFFLQVPEEADADWIVAPRADVSVASTKKIRAESSSFEDVEANGGVQPLTKKTAAADTERIVAVPDSIDEEIHEPDANN